MGVSSYPPPGFGMLPVGALLDWPGQAAVPALFLEAKGTSVLRATYPSLFAALNRSLGTVTFTTASPTVVTTSAAHGLQPGDNVFFETTGTLPTSVWIFPDQPLIVLTTPTSTTFTLGTSSSSGGTFPRRIPGGGPVAVTAPGSGVHTGYVTPYSIPLGSATNFYLPDLRAASVMGADDSGANYSQIGYATGETTHTLTSGESGVPAHTHPSLTRVVSAFGGAGGNLGTAGGYNEFTYAIAANTPADAASGHNTVHPVVIMRKIIYAGA